MALEGLHHITAITADAPRNVDFYARVLGLRLVKKTVNFDQPDVYHLYYGDETGAPGSILTFFEFPTAAPGRAGDGMLHTILWRVAGSQALDFWEQRLRTEGIPADRQADGALGFADPEGLAHELVPTDGGDPPLVASAPDIPAEHAILGLHGVRAYSARPDASAPLLQALGFELREEAGAWESRGVERHGFIRYDPPPALHPIQGAGTVHHVAWSAADDTELEALRRVAMTHGAHATLLIDRQYFHSVYFREPSGVLFEVASRDIGFDVDEPAATLGQALKLPPQYEERRAELERALTPVRNPRQTTPA